LSIVVDPLPAYADYEAGKQALAAGQPDKAAAEWRGAAAKGDRRAMLGLGRLHVQGVGVVQDYVAAHMWFNLSASKGEAAAVKERDAVAAKMTPGQVAEAQKRAAAWPPQRATGASPSPTGDQAAVSGASVREAQRLLAELGYAPGPPDGRWGRRSAEAYGAFLRDAGLPASDALTGQALQALRDASKDREEGATATPRPREPACDGKPKEGGCWLAFANQRNCLFWNLYDFSSDQNLTWSGACRDQVAEGRGRLMWKQDDKTNEALATMSQGKLHGQQIVRFSNGNVWEGRYADGEMHGPSIFRKANGEVIESSYVLSKRHGEYVRRDEAGKIVEKGRYVTGKKHGQWVEPGRLGFFGGKVAEGPYMNGERHGTWVVRDRQGKVVGTGPYVNGKRHGVFSELDILLGKRCVYQYENGRQKSKNCRR